MSLQKNEGKKEKKGKGRKGKKAIKGGIQHERDTSGACTPLEKMPYSILGCSSVAAGAGAAGSSVIGGCSSVAGLAASAGFAASAALPHQQAWSQRAWEEGLGLVHDAGGESVELGALAGEGGDGERGLGVEREGVLLVALLGEPRAGLDAARAHLLALGGLDVAVLVVLVVGGGRARPERTRASRSAMAAGRWLNLGLAADVAVADGL